MSFISRIPRGNPLGCALVTVACLSAGYLDLWRGGTTVAATLLVVGYLVLVPLSLRAAYLSHDGAPLIEPEDVVPPYRAAAIVGLVVLALYVATLAPSTAMWDASEYIAVARVLGIPHPPGNPLFVLVAHVFAEACALLRVPLTYAGRVNLLAATTSAVSAALWFLVTHRSLRGSGLPPHARVAAAVAAAWLGATAFSVWNQSVVNEKVYTLALLGVALCAWLSLRWLDAPAGSRKSDLLLVMVAYLCGLGYANHPAGFLPLPAVGVLLLLRRPATLLRWRVIGAAMFALSLGLTPFLFEPIRASHGPVINEGEPTACVGGPRLDCILSATTWTRLSANIRREQYGGHAVAVRQAPLDAQTGMWWLYWKWQWWRDAAGVHQPVQQLLAVAFLLLAGLGAISHWKRDRDSFCLVAPLIITLTPALIFYLNFRYGWSQSVELGDGVPREVRDRDYFYVWSFASLAVWIGVGLATLWRWIAETVRNASSTSSSPSAAPMGWSRRWALAAPVLLVACIPLAGNYRYAPRHDHHFTAAWAHDLLSSVEPYGILITNGDNDSFPLWYAQEVEGVRRDVSVVLVPYLGTDWYVRQLIRARVQPYNGEGLAAFRSSSRTPPTRPMFALSDSEADAVPHYIELREPSEFRHGEIRGVVPPGIVTRDQLLVLRLIADSFPARPVYFSLGNYPQALGLGEHVVTQGLTQRLVQEPATSRASAVRVGDRYVDTERSEQLWAAYRGPDALLRERDWVDAASAMLPAAYAFTGQSLAGALESIGRPDDATAVYQQTAAVARKLGLIAR
ncbi:MAG TPA: DUF2723 domain-containing protein [Gemmatimonas sp.]|nr:DUF2723 domain-containing protein [Gemmatimonas sp.]